jgi:hypothetical protein
MVSRLRRSHADRLGWRRAFALAAALAAGGCATLSGLDALQIGDLAEEQDAAPDAPVDAPPDPPFDAADASVQDTAVADGRTDAAADAPRDTGVDAQRDAPAEADAGSCGPFSFNVQNSGMQLYVINGASNPTLTLCAGQTYSFVMNAPGHPLWIKTVRSTGTQYAWDAGVTNNGSDTKTITVAVPASAPNPLFYNCENHAGMQGTLVIQ